MMKTFISWCTFKRPLNATQHEFYAVALLFLCKLNYDLATITTVSKY